MGTGLLLRDGWVVDEKTIIEYVENQRWDENAESFRVTESTKP